jgi:hypothetical protein
LQPIAALLAEEASEKFGGTVTIDVMRPLSAFDAGGRARALLTVTQALAMAKQARYRHRISPRLSNWSIGAIDGHGVSDRERLAVAATEDTGKNLRVVLRPSWRSTQGNELRWLTREDLEAAIDLWHRFKGRPLSRRAGYLIVAAVALEADVPQLIVHGLFKTFGIDVPILETPRWVSLGFAALAAVLLVADRLLPERVPIPRPNPHDVELFRRFRALL